MKKLILTLTIAAFASVSAVQAGDAKTCDTSKTSGSCSASAKHTVSASKSSCSAGQTACCATAKQAKKSTPATAKGAYLAQK
jgi:hypothetical protein